MTTVNAKWAEPKLSSADTLPNQHQTVAEGIEYMRSRAVKMRNATEEVLHQSQHKFQKMLLDLANNYPIEIMCSIASDEPLEQVFGRDMVHFAKANRMLFDAMCEFDKVGTDS